MSIIAIITARGGSKRIPRKNIKDFCGKPIIAYSIQAALESGIFDHVMVSTDDEEIADILRRSGKPVILAVNKIEQIQLAVICLRPEIENGDLVCTKAELTEPVDRTIAEMFM